MKFKRQLTKRQRAFGILLHTHSAFLQYYWRDELTLRTSRRQRLLQNDLSDNIVVATGRKTFKTGNFEGHVIREGIQPKKSLTECMIVTPGQKQLDPLRDRIATRITRNPLFKMLLQSNDRQSGMMKWAGGTIHYFRLEGTSGTDQNMVGLRAAKVYMDEFQLGNAVCHNSRVQSALPHCKMIYGGVPDGRRGTIAWKIDSTPLGRSWSHHKTSTYINPLYWTLEQRDRLREQYNGVNSPAYITQVLGHWGRQLRSSFPLDNIAIGGGAYQFASIGGRDIPNSSDDALARTVLLSKLKIPRVDATGPRLYILGMDFGNKSDPTELALATLDEGNENAILLRDWHQFMRIQVNGADQVQQAVMLEIIIETLGIENFGAVCVDMLGPGQGVGAVLKRLTHNPEFWREVEDGGHLVNFSAGSLIEVPPMFESETGEKRKPVKMRRKEYFTIRFQTAMICARSNIESDLRMWISDDEKVIQELIATTETKTPEGRLVYIPPGTSEHPDDHCTDMLRALACAAIETKRLVDISVEEKPSASDKYSTDAPLFKVPEIFRQGP